MGQLLEVANTGARALSISVCRVWNPFSRDGRGMKNIHAGMRGTAVRHGAIVWLLVD